MTGATGTVRVIDRTRGDAVLARRARLADTHWTRLRGLLGRPRLEPGEGLVVSPSRGVHTWGMRYPIDVALADGEGRVVALYPGLGPWRRTRVHRAAALAVELPEGTLWRTGTRVGHRLDLRPHVPGPRAAPVVPSRPPSSEVRA